MGVNLNMIYPDTCSTSGYRHFLQGVFSPKPGVAAKTVHIMWSCASAAMLHQPLLCTNHFVPVVPNRLDSKQSKCLTLSERKRDHEFTVNTSSSESGDSESEGLVTAEATARICTVNWTNYNHH